MWGTVEADFELMTLCQSAENIDNGLWMKHCEKKLSQHYATT